MNNNKKIISKNSSNKRKNLKKIYEYIIENI